MGKSPGLTIWYEHFDGHFDLHDGWDAPMISPLQERELSRRSVASLHAPMAGHAMMQSWI